MGAYGGAGPVNAQTKISVNGPVLELAVLPPYPDDPRLLSSLAAYKCY